MRKNFLSLTHMVVESRYYPQYFLTFFLADLQTSIDARHPRVNGIVTEPPPVIIDATAEPHTIISEVVAAARAAVALKHFQKLPHPQENPGV